MGLFAAQLLQLLPTPPQATVVVNKLLYNIGREKHMTTEKRRAGYFWFKASLVAGTSLAVLLLVQSVTNYIYVSRRLVVEQTQRDAHRQVASLERQAMQMHLDDRLQLASLLDELQKEEDRRCAWIRVVGVDGQIVAQAGRPTSRNSSDERVQSPPRNRPPVWDVREGEKGRVLVEVVPIRLPPAIVGRLPEPGPPSSMPALPGARPRPRGPGPARVEIALYLEGSLAAFWPLRRNMILNCSAAVALLASMILLGFRIRPYIRAREIEQQLELARNVQRELLPPPKRSIGNVDLAAVCEPAWEVGGDFYDVFATDQGSLALVLGDVAGKGLPAALLMGLIQGAVRASAGSSASSDHEKACRRLNQLLCSHTSTERFATLFWAYYDDKSGLLKYINAGHPAPLMLTETTAGAIEVRDLAESSPVMGLLPAARYQQGSSLFSRGDLLCIYSDGVVEASNAEGEEFGRERLRSALVENWKRPPWEIQDEVLRELQNFVGSKPPDDDLTILLVRPGENAKPQEKPGPGEAELARV